MMWPDFRTIISPSYNELPYCPAIFKSLTGAGHRSLLPIIHHQSTCFCMPACALSWILQKTLDFGRCQPHATRLSANALQTIPNGKPASAHALSLPARSHSQTPDQNRLPDLKSPLACSISSSKAHAPLRQAWRGYSPNYTQGSAVPYIARPSQLVSSKLVMVATHNSKLLA